MSADDRQEAARRAVNVRWKQVRAAAKLSAYAAAMVKQRNRSLTPEQRTEIARKAAQTRWKKSKRAVGRRSAS